MERYPVAIFREEEGGEGYWAAVPDLPGCNTCGKSVEDVIRMARNAAAGWVASMVETVKGEVPGPSPIEVHLKREPEEYGGAVCWAFIEVETPAVA